VIYENDFINYHVILFQLNDNQSHTIVDQVNNVSEDVASSFMLNLIETYQLKDDVQVMDKIFVNGQHKKTLYQTIGKFKEVYNNA
jgi:hypothetical protein